VETSVVAEELIVVCAHDIVDVLCRDEKLILASVACGFGAYYHHD